jgi:hypothetical protein
MRISTYRLAAVRLAVVAASVMLATPGVARIKVQVEFDKAYDFRQVRTWAWRAEGPGEVKMAVTKDDDPEAVKARFEPVLVTAVQDEMTKRGLTMTTTGPPNVRVRYFLLISTGTSAQEFGQFASWTAWGLPPVEFGQTQSLRVLMRGSLLLDVVPEGGDLPVWRGAAQAEIHRDRSADERAQRLRESVRDLLKRFPPGGRS